MLTLIAGIAKNGAIGRGNTIPWHVPEDLSFFSRETQGGAVIMGRRTWESLPVRPLPRRFNIVISSRALPSPCARSPEEALEIAKTAGHLRVYGIGGRGVYEDLLPKADRILLSRVDVEVPDADTFFPAFDLKDWCLKDHLILSVSDPGCVVSEYMRR